MNTVMTHMWTSTLVLFLALIAARFLPLTARTRYAVLLFGLFKFALPAAILTAPLHAIFGRQAVETISIAWLDSRIPLSALTPSPASSWPLILRIGWIVPAVALAAAWLIARRRIVASALRGATPASPREHAALDAARRQLQMRRAVDVMRSPICEAPVVMRVIRPIIVLPDGGCDALDPAELESLLRHECAHVARVDNAFTFVESAIVAAFWFHPLVWIAQRAIASAREEACDETAASTPGAVDIYISALTKICIAALAPSTAGVSCMASAHLKERLDHLMSYDTHRALSHRLVVILAALIVAGVTLASDIKPTNPDTSKYPYKMFIEVHPGDDPDTLVFSGRIVEAGTNRLFAQPNVAFKRHGTAKIRSGNNDGVTNREAEIEVRDTGSSIAVVLRMSKDGALIQESNYQAIPRAERKREYTGASISLDLKDADIKDVLQRFSQISGIKIDYPDTLQGKVTMTVREMPWDEAFDSILREQHLSWVMTGDTMTIKEK
ncbi:MAG: secretin and TonB N-terminal domain-containing protein [Acidobacteriota bacterium]|nr:secretin and TonB N-terminal domain-containing protein [Acidobacteriota bacterium]